MEDYVKQINLDERWHELIDGKINNSYLTELGQETVVKIANEKEENAIAIVDFGHDMYCNGYDKGYSDGIKGLRKTTILAGIAGATVSMCAALSAYFIKKSIQESNKKAYKKSKK